MSDTTDRFRSSRHSLLDEDVSAAVPHLRGLLAVVPEAEHVFAGRDVARDVHEIDDAELELAVEAAVVVSEPIEVPVIGADRFATTIRRTPRAIAEG